MTSNDLSADQFQTLVDEAIGWRELTALSLVCAGIAINLMAARRA